MSEYNENGEQEPASEGAITPEVVEDPIKKISAISKQVADNLHNGDILANRREEVAKTIESTFMSAIQKMVNRREYDTQIKCTNGPEPMSINISITTNDPRVIAALASAGSKTP